MTFEQVLPLIKQGKKAFRLAWKEKRYMVRQLAYPQGIPCNKQTADVWGLNEGDLFKCNPYFQVKNSDGTHSMYVPTVDDIFANDWEVIK